MMSLLQVLRWQEIVDITASSKFLASANFAGMEISLKNLRQDLESLKKGLSNFCFKD